jgi:hypothetical protein
MIYRLEKALPEGMRIVKKGENAPLKFYNGVVSARLSIGMHPVLKNAFDTGLDATKQKYFEEKIGLEEGALATRGSYWPDFGIKITADGLILNDENPEDELKLFQLNRRKDVAKSALEARTKAGIKWILTSEESEAEIEVARRDYLINALKAFGDMTPTEMRTYLESQKMDTSNMNDSIVKKKVGDEAEKSPKKFLIIVNDPRKADKIFMHELIKYGVLKHNGTKYVNEDNVPLALSDDDMLVFLADKNNTAQVAIWKKQLGANKKNR